MPATVITQIFQDADELLNQTLFGETVTYTPITGVAKSITMRIDRGVNLGKDRASNVTQGMGASDAVSYQAIGYVAVADIANPVYLDSISATGPGGNAETWTVLLIIQSDSSTHAIALRDDLRPQI